MQQIHFLIDLHRRARLVGIPIEWSHNYFDWEQGRNRIDELESKTRIYLPTRNGRKYIEPDAIFLMETPV